MTTLITIPPRRGPLTRPKRHPSLGRVPLEFTVPIRLDPNLVRAMAPNPWNVDAGYAPTTAMVDGRTCIPNRGEGWPYSAERPCWQEERICDWAFLKANTVCNDETFLRVMFQGDRFIWAQTQLRALLAAKPTEEVLVPAAAAIPRERERVRNAHVSQMVDWCRDILSLVSLARWATNIHPRWQGDVYDGPAVRETLARFKTSLPFTPREAFPGDVGKHDFQNTPAMWVPRVFDIQPGVEFSVPTTKEDFAPNFVGRMKRLNVTPPNEQLRAVGRDQRITATVPIRRPPFGVWPSEYAAPSGWQPLWAYFDANPRLGVANDASRDIDMVHSREAMILWFKKTMGMSSPWIQGYEVNRMNYRHAWGTADVQIALCEAWARDIVNTTFGDMVADGFQRFINAVDNLPPHLRGMSLAQIRALRDAASAQVVNETNAIVGTIVGTVGGVAVALISATAGTGPGAIVGAVAAAVAAVVMIAVEIAAALGAFAPDRAELNRSCLAPPVLRMIISDVTNACNFDPRFENVDRVRSQTAAITQLKDSVGTWFTASRIGAGEDAANPNPGEGSEGGSGTGEINPLLILGGLTAVGLVGYLALRK